MALRRAREAAFDPKPERVRTWLRGVGAAEITMGKAEAPTVKTLLPATEVATG